jgi:hypothetical protein
MATRPLHGSRRLILAFFDSFLAPFLASVRCSGLQRKGGLAQTPWKMRKKTRDNCTIRVRSRFEFAAMGAPPSSLALPPRRLPARKTAAIISTPHVYARPSAQHPLSLPRPFRLQESEKAEFETEGIQRDAACRRRRYQRRRGEIDQG